MTLTNLRTNFDAICRTLCHRDKAKRVRYIRQSEKTVTLSDLMKIGFRIDREVGIYLDKQGGSRRNSDICLFAGDKINLRPRNHSLTVGANIEFPPGGPSRYRIVAHYHPTDSNESTQLMGDIRQANENIEMVVNVRGYVFYYNQDGCYNEKTSTRQGSFYKNNLKNLSKSKYSIGLDEGIGPLTLFFLNKIKPDSALRSLAISNDEEDAILFGDSQDVITFDNESSSASLDDENANAEVIELTQNIAVPEHAASSMRFCNTADIYKTTYSSAFFSRSISRSELENKEKEFQSNKQRGSKTQFNLG